MAPANLDKDRPSTTLESFFIIGSVCIICVLGFFSLWMEDEANQRRRQDGVPEELLSTDADVPAYYIAKRFGIVEDSVKATQKLVEQALQAVNETSGVAGPPPYCEEEKDV